MPGLIGSRVNFHNSESNFGSRSQSRVRVKNFSHKVKWKSKIFKGYRISLSVPPMTIRLPSGTKPRQDKSFRGLVLYCLVSVSWKFACHLSDKSWQAKVWPRFSKFDKRLSTGWQALVTDLTSPCIGLDKRLSHEISRIFLLFISEKIYRNLNWKIILYLSSYPLKKLNIQKMIQKNGVKNGWPRWQELVRVVTRVCQGLDKRLSMQRQALVNFS